MKRYSADPSPPAASVPVPPTPVSPPASVGPVTANKLEAEPPPASRNSTSNKMSLNAPAPLFSSNSVPRNAERVRVMRSEEHTSELQSQSNLVCRLLLEKKKKK